MLLCYAAKIKSRIHYTHTLLFFLPATKIETCWRGVQARKERERRAWAVKVIKKWEWRSKMYSIIAHLKVGVTCLLLQYLTTCFRFIKGYMTRGQAKTTDNSEYLAFVRQNYLNRLKENLPKTVLDKNTWQTPPAVLTEVQCLIRFIVKEITNKRSHVSCLNPVHVFILVRHQRSCVSFTTVYWWGSMWEESHPRKKHR